MFRQKQVGYLGRQMLGYSIVLLLVVIILFAWVSSYVRDFSNRNMAAVQAQVTQSAAAHVDSYLDRMLFIATQVSQDQDVAEIMAMLQDQVNNRETCWFWKRGHRDTSRQLYQLLDSHNFAEDPVWRISVYNDLGDYMSVGAGVSYQKMEEILRPDHEHSVRLRQTFLEQEAEFLLLTPLVDPLSDAEGSYVCLIVPIRDGAGQICGFVDVQRSLQPLHELLALDEHTGMDAYLFAQGDGAGGQTLVYPPNAVYPTLLPEEDLLLRTGTTKHGWEIRVILDQSRWNNAYSHVLSTVFGVFSAIFLLLFVGIILVSRSTSRPILELSEKIRKATLADSPDRWRTNQDIDEIKALEQSFDIMMQRIKTSVELEKKAYLKALQSQMNPHFLYNSLFAISSMAMELEDRTIPKFCDHLAAMLRYESVSADSLVPMEEELNYIRDYLELMKLRFEGDFDYLMYIDPVLTELRLPRLTLQPIVENCFEHAFNQVPPPWRITLRTCREDGCWVISVADNGSGFDEGKRRQLQAQIEARSGDDGRDFSDLVTGGLGLTNTILRLRLALDEDIAYSIAPEMPTGTIVTLKGTLNP